MIKTTDANNNGIHFSYDASDRISTVTDALGNVRKYTYNAGGKVTGLTDFDGKTVSFDYNDLGKSATYTEQGRIPCRDCIRQDVERKQHKSHRTVEYSGSYTTATTGLRSIRCLWVEKSGMHMMRRNLLSETDTAGNTARYAYDEADRLVRMEAADGAVTTFGYDHEGNLVSETDALGHVTEYTYDDLGRRTGVTDAAGETTSVCYNEIGNVDRICHPNGSSTV